MPDSDTINRPVAEVEASLPPPTSQILPTHPIPTRPIPTRPIPTRPIPTRPIPTRPIPIPTRPNVPSPTISFEEPHDAEQELRRRERDQGRDRGREPDEEDRRLDWATRVRELRRSQRQERRERERELEVNARVQAMRDQQAADAAALENWQNWFPFQFPRAREINEILTDWLRPMEFNERMEALSEMGVGMTTIIDEARQREREMRRLCETNDQLGARMALQSLADRLDHVRKHVRRHIHAHYTLECLYVGPTSDSLRIVTEDLESRLCLPVRSCFFGNYRVGFGDLQDYLERDPGLRERAHGAEVAGTSIADLPAWEIPNLEQEDVVYDPPPGWRAIVPRFDDEPLPSTRRHHGQSGRASRRERARADHYTSDAGSLEGLMYEYGSDFGDMEVIDGQGWSEDDADDEGDEMPPSTPAYR